MSRLGGRCRGVVEVSGAAWAGIRAGSEPFIALKRGQRYTAVIGRAGVFLAVPRVRFVFSESVRDVQLGSGGPPGGYAGESGWRAVTRVLRSCSAAMKGTIADFTNILMPSDCRVCGGAMVALAPVRICEACTARVGS